jgi:UDP:flavonoid glycosyltransferase YjiC (YdhE family)
MNLDRQRILLVAESLTLAQVVRLVALARALDVTRYEVHFASSEFDPIAFHGTDFRRWPLHSIDKREAMRKLERGRRLYELDVLRGYVQEELELIERVRPALVVGDFRLSLAVSAAVSGVRCATLINAYWSPYAERDGFPVPDHPIVSLLGVELAERYFPRAIGSAFAHFAAPVNALRKAYGLPAVDSLLGALTQGDLVLYPDVPELCPTRGLPPHHHYLGYVPWAPDVTLPRDVAAQIDAGKPLVYLTLGSSGRASALPAVLEALADLPVTVLLASAARALPTSIPENVHVAEYVRGDVAARAARLVVTNGGSSTGYQALAAGKPVLGLASNLDQYLAMTAIQKAGAGRLVRAARATSKEVRSALLELLDSKEPIARANELARAFARVDCHERFERILSSSVQGVQSARSS